MNLIMVSGIMKTSIHKICHHMLKDFIIKDLILADSLIILGSKVLRRLSISLLQILVPDLVETQIEIADSVGIQIVIQMHQENPETEIQHLYLMITIAIGAWVVQIMLVGLKIEVLPDQEILDVILDEILEELKIKIR